MGIRKDTIFGDVTTYSLVEVYQRFGGTYSFLLSALQPWVSLGLLYNQSLLLSIPHLLFPSFHLHLLQVTLNIV
jgi:hypothetical protein